MRVELELSGETLDRIVKAELQLILKAGKDFTDEKVLKAAEILIDYYGFYEEKE